MTTPQTMLLNRLKDAKHQALFVGGCVRDELLGRTPKDWDICTSASPLEIESIFSDFKTIDVGKKFGVVVVVVDGTPFEIATFRAETYDTSRKPTVTRVSTFVEDASRRDFTINAMGDDGKEIVDYFTGRHDICNKIIRFVGDPFERIEEDRLRVLRGFRFMSKLGFSFADKTREAIAHFIQKKDMLTGVSQERITSEFKQILIGDNAFDAVIEMAKTDALWEIMPDLKASLEPHNNDWHQETMEPWGNSIFAHIMQVFKHACIETADENDDVKLRVRLAALMHDIGKPSCRVTKTDHDSFSGHDKVGAEMTSRILTQMKFENDTVKRVAKLVGGHMDLHNLLRTTKPSFVRMLLGRRDIDELLTLGRSDEAGTTSTKKRGLPLLMNAVNIAREQFPVMLPDPIVSGDDLIAAGFKPSEKFSKCLHTLFKHQLNTASITKESLLKMAKGML